ncbi:hypothetical protein ACEQ8H_008584 [Pleosporales sp. CAS-2024a]
MQRMPWHLAALLFAVATTADIAPSNSSTDASFPAVLPLKHADSVIAQLIPLSSAAQTTTVHGNLVHITYDNRTNVSADDIAYISCNQDDVTGLYTPQQVFEDAYRTASMAAVILYSTATNYCNYSMTHNNPMLQDFPILSMTSMQSSASLLDLLSNATASSPFPVTVEAQNPGNATTRGPDTTTSPLGPSPSTAVAMIILYSITGIITALFLVIIITGAVRAHRHPERYGPRNVVGRPRQSRARGLGRAILDTIPIVKFGEKEPEKSTDVELASTTESSRGPDAQTTQMDHASTAANGTPPANEATTATTREAPLPALEEHQEGIAPAAVAVAGAGAESSPDESLGCSICTEDFEKGQDLRVLPCDHKFHPECVDPWLLNVSGTCPLCRVDLRPVASNSSNPNDADPNASTAPADATASELPHRSAFRDILSLRHRPNATPQERIYYLRRLREQRRNRSGDLVQPAEDANEQRRSDPCTINSRKVLAGLEEMQADYQQNYINYFTSEHKSEEFAKINPHKTVPAATDGDLTLTESNAILVYAAEKSGSSMYPKDVKQRANVNRWLLWEASSWFPTCYVYLVQNVVVPNLMKGTPDQKAIDAESDKFHQSAGILDAQLSKTKWIAGDHLTVADIAIAAPMHLYKEQKLPLENYPNLKHWMENGIEQLDSWKATAAPVEKALFPHRVRGSPAFYLPFKLPSN